MKKLFLCFAICFGVFVCQNVVAQSVTKVNATPTNLSALNNNGQTTQSNAAIPVLNANVVVKQAQQVQLQGSSTNGGNTNSTISLQVNQPLLKSGQPVQINSRTYQAPSGIPLGRAVIEQ